MPLHLSKNQKLAWYIHIFETRSESNVVCPTKVPSWICVSLSLSEGILYESCADPHPHDQHINRANLCENEMVLTYYKKWKSGH